MNICPRSGSPSRLIRRNSVVFPEPLRPISATVSPALISRLMSRSTGREALSEVEGRLADTPTNWTAVSEANEEEQ
jgi:hypothetical protein